MLIHACLVEFQHHLEGRLEKISIIIKYRVLIFLECMKIEIGLELFGKMFAEYEKSIFGSHIHVYDISLLMSNGSE